MDKTKQMRFTDSELSIIKNTFSENEVLLKAIRKVFLQIDLSVEETLMIENLAKHKELLKVIRKTFLPTIDGDAPLHQVIDLWATLKIEGKEIDTVYNEAFAREKLIEYLDQRLKVIEGKKVTKPIDFYSMTSLGDKSDLDIFVDLTVRNLVISHVEMQLMQFHMLAGLKEETVEETKARLFKDSSK